MVFVSDNYADKNRHYTLILANMQVTVMQVAPSYSSFQSLVVIVDYMYCIGGVTLLLT